MIHLSTLTRSLAVATIGLLGMAPGAVAGPPSPQDLNPPPPDFYDCRTLGAVTLCTGLVHEIKVSEEQPELVCGSGPDAFTIHDNGIVDQSWTRWYNADGYLTKRVVQERWSDTFWSNPLTGKTVTYTQRATFTTSLAVPGDFASATETTVGENIYTDPATRKQVLRSVGRTVFGADGNLESQAGQQPFIDAFIDGDMSVFDPICAALG